MQRKDPESIGDILRQMLIANGGYKRIKEIRLTQEWDKIVGPMIARNTEEINLKDGVLSVKFRSAIVRNEISMRRTSLQKLLNDTMHEQIVKEIVVK
jgi:predicted nucleic acid-binding Zn ribbon protein